MSLTRIAMERVVETHERRRIGALVMSGALVATAIMTASLAGAEPFISSGFGPGQDARAYWVADAFAPYSPASVGRESAYLYSPAFLQALAPLRALPWPVFLGAWTAILLAVALVLARPLLFAPLLVVTLIEIWGGNIHLLLALAIVLGFRWPAAWAFVLLTKVTPGIGLLWFVVRREWRQLAIALAATALVAGVSFVLTPHLWRAWVGLLLGSVSDSTAPGSIPIPLIVRLPIAVLVIGWAARTDRAWLLPVGAMLALPVLWWGGLSMLAGSVALRRTAIEEWVLRRLADLDDDRERSGSPAAVG